MERSISSNNVCCTLPSANDAAHSIFDHVARNSRNHRPILPAGPFPLKMGSGSIRVEKLNRDHHLRCGRAWRLLGLSSSSPEIC